MSNDRFNTGGGAALLDDVRSASDSLPGSLLGDYRVLDLIAAGGMGRVYRAERVDGSFERMVAVKVSPISGFSGELRERFQREQQLLAGLNHPHIAQLFDAQVTEEGWPYIVMELVDGGPVDEYCETHSLNLVDRLRMFIAIVDAVALAHSRLVVHRDIKPSNVLVTADGRPKLLDFGIAKTLEQENLVATQVAPFTPRYASPEQLLRKPATIASDVFQLGHLLHRVLTGSSLAEDLPLADAIRNAALQKPVTIPESSRRKLPRDLVAIIEHCLRYAAEDRYPDARTLGNDLRAFLDGYPVQAAGQGSGYRLRKFIGRHMLASTISAAAVVLIVGGVSWYTWQLAVARDEALHARHESEAVLEFVVEMLASASPNAEGENFRVSDALDGAATTLTEDLEASPYVRARIHDVIGDTFKALGREADAEVQHAARLAIYDDLGDLSHPARFDALYDLAWLSREKGNFEEAFRLGQEAIDSALQAHGPRSPITARAMQALASSYLLLADFQSAKPLIEDAVEIYSSLPDPEGEYARASLSALARLEYLQENYDAAVEHYEQVYEMDAARFGEEHIDTLVTMGNLLEAKRKHGLMDEVIAGRRKQLDIMRRHLGLDHPYTLVTMITLAANMEASAENFSERVQLVQSATDAYLQQGDPDSSRVLSARFNLGTIYRQHGRFAEAARVHAENLPAVREVFGNDSPLTLYVMGDLAMSLCRQGERESALPLFEEFHSKAPLALGDEHRLVALYEQEFRDCRNG